MRTGFYTAVLFGMIGLVEAVSSPAAGLLQAVLFFGAAWGIRRGHPWAAMAALTLVAAPIVAALARGLAPGMAAGIAIAGLVLLAATALFGYSAAVLFRRRGAGLLTGKDWIVAVLVLGVFAACFALQPYNMPTQSMANTLKKGDFLLVDVASPALGWTARQDTLVVFHPPHDPRQTFIKRVAALPGDRIRIREKHLLRNGAPVREPWAVHLTDDTDSYRDNFPISAPNTTLSDQAKAMLAKHVQGDEVIVPAGMLFVLGDNRDSSLDSRYFGLVPQRAVVGRPLLVYGSTSPDARFQWIFRRL